jgi:hypothetical protein
MAGLGGVGGGVASVCCFFDELSRSWRWLYSFLPPLLLYSKLRDADLHTAGFDWASLPRGSVVVDVDGGTGSKSMLLASVCGGGCGW